MFFRLFPCFALLLLTAALSLPAFDTQAQGLSLDALMEDETPTTTNKPQVQQPPETRSSGASPSLGFDDIYAGREQTRQQRAIDELRGFDRRLANRCGCVTQGCYNFADRQISQASVIEAGEKAAAQMNGQLRDACGKWQAGRNLSAHGSTAVASQLRFANDVTKVLDQLDASATDIRRNLISKDKEISRAIAQQQQSQSNFDWGKAMALGVGALAGGLDQLSSEAQAKILSSIVADSYGGAEGMSNLQATVNSLSVPSSGNLAGSAGGALGGGSGGGGSGGGFVIDEQFQFSCPHGGNHSVPIKAKSTACGQAMRRYAKVAGCNLIDDMQSAQDNYYSACASEMYE